jgi:hypothetical protein
LLRRRVQSRGEGVDIGARQRRGGERDVVIGDAVRLGEIAGFAGGQLAGVFGIRAVVDNRTHARSGERFDIVGVELAGGAQPGGELGEGR